MIDNKYVKSRNLGMCKKIGSKSGHSFRLLKACTENTINRESYRRCLINIDGSPEQFNAAKIKACTEISRYPNQLDPCLKAVTKDVTADKIRDCKGKIRISDKDVGKFYYCFTK